VTPSLTSQSTSADPPSTGGAGAAERRPEPEPSLTAVILAAGQGTRMRSRHHKVLHPLAGRPLISRVLALVRGAGARPVVVVLGHLADQVRAVLPPDVSTVAQEPQRGTGHAVQVAAGRLRAAGAQRLLVHLGDTALVRPESLAALVAAPIGPQAPVALLTARLADPRGYGRVIRGPDGTVLAMVEEIEATPEQRSVDEVWSGSMLLWSEWLWDRLFHLPEHSGGEYYLTDLVNLAREEGRAVKAVLAADEDEVRGVNDRAQLAVANAIVRQRTIAAHQAAGVTVVDPATTYIEPEVQIAADVTVQPGCHLQGASRIDADAEIGPNTMLADAHVGERSRVWWSVLEGARVGRDVKVGPFSHLRPGAVVEDGAVVGNYAEVKASRIGPGTQVHHFSYLGDADVGASVNVGAGTITCNYNAETGAKSRTVVEDGAALGSDTMLIAPVTVGANGMTGAGAIVTRDIGPDEVWVGAPARRVRKRTGPRRRATPPATAKGPE